MSVSLDAGKVSRLIATVDGDKGSVCDNEWHTIKASYSQEFLNLRVDKNEPRSDIIRNTIVKEIRTQSPLYVGGLPGKKIYIYPVPFASRT